MILGVMLVARDSKFGHLAFFSFMETYIFSFQMLHNQACISVLSTLGLEVGKLTLKCAHMLQVPGLEELLSRFRRLLVHLTKMCMCAQESLIKKSLEIKVLLTALK